ncbi:ribonuclease HI [Trypanosoma cruzi]|nr:ribonuclease HI [Trypanosoma cruzi]
MRLSSAIVIGVKPLAFVGIGGGELDFGCRVAFADHSFTRWLTSWRLLSTAPPDFTTGMLREQGAYTRRNTCRMLPAVTSSMVRSVRLQLLDAPRSTPLRRSLGRSLRSAWGAAAMVRSNSASPGVQNGDGWRLPAGTVALVAFCIPDEMCLSVLSMLVNSRGILQSWLVIPLRLFQFAFSHANNVLSRLGTTAGDSSSPIRNLRRMMQWPLSGEGCAAHWTTAQSLDRAMSGR